MNTLKHLILFDKIKFAIFFHLGAKERIRTSRNSRRSRMRSYPASGHLLC